MSGAPDVVGILAGGGSLPREIAEHVRASGGTVHIVSIIGEGDRDLGDFPLTRVGWAQIGGMVRALRNAGVTKMVIVGAVRRPDLNAIKPDLGFFLNLPAIGRIVATTGDDSVLSGVVRFFESKGFKVALVTDGRMSGASGAVPAAIHLTPECLSGGPLARIQNGDIITLDSYSGMLNAQVPDDVLAKRAVATPDLSRNHHGAGRELFATFRAAAGDAEMGAMGSM